MEINENDEKEVVEKRMEEYKRTRQMYLSLCKRSELNPFDLHILMVGASRIPKKDKAALVKYIIRLTRLERELKGVLDHGLFPLTVKGKELSGYLVPAHH